MGLIKKGPWFIFARTEIGGGASFTFLNEGIKIWCHFTSSTGTRLFERRCHSPEGFREVEQRGPLELWACFLRFTIQRPGNLIYIPHLLAYAVLTVDTRSPTILSGRDAATTSNQQVIFQTLDEYIFRVRRGKWREFSVKKVYQHYESGCFLLQLASKKAKISYRNTGNIGNSTLLVYYCHYTSKKRFP